MKNMVSKFCKKDSCKIAALFTAVILVLVVHGFGLLNAAIYEIGDYAANTILVLKAKKLDLFVGNYSRIGFNHPGPAILYVLAFGEMIFYDMLHLFPTPFSGQILAGFIYKAAWIAAAFFWLDRILKSWRSALIVLGGTLVVLLATMPEVGMSLWFPLMYVFPFLVAVLSMVRLASGKPDALIGMALAMGFLCNGHASFPALLAVMVFLTIAGNFMLSCEGKYTRVLSKDFLWQNRFVLGVSLTLLFLFFVPLIIMTVKNFPGPVGDYFYYGHGHHRNKIKESFHYVFAYWGGWPIAWPALFALILTLVPGRFSSVVLRLVPAGKEIAVVFLAATVAVLLYTIFGIDNLSEDYVCLFYYVVPALFCGLAFMLLANVFPAKLRAPPVAAVLAYTCVVALVFRSPPTAYAHADVPEVYQAIKTYAEQQPNRGRLVLDLDNAASPAAWGPAVGLEAYGLRHGENLICVNHAWHILHTRDMRCSDTEAANNQHIVVASQVGSNYTILAEDKDEGTGIYFALIPASYAASEFTHTILKDRLFFRDYFLGSDWSNISNKEEYVWSDGPLPRLNLVLPDQPFSGTLTLDLGSFLPFAISTQTVTYLVNGKSVGTDVFSHANQRHMAIIPLVDMRGKTTVDLKIKDVVSPRAAGVNGDERLLAISLYGATLTRNRTR